MTLVVVAIFIIALCVTQHCTSLSLSPLPPPQHRSDAVGIVVQQSNDPSAATALIQQSNFAGAFRTSPSFLLSASTVPEVQTQSQQMNDAMVIKTMKGTQWRVVEDRLISDAASNFFGGKEYTRYCKSLATFGGFTGVDNKGTVGVEYFCGSQNVDESSDSATKTFTSKGRWVTKPSRLARGSVQLSARWKVRLPDGGGTVIYKGFIDADKIIGRKGKSINAEMVGVILTGEEVNKEKVIGKFTADFVRQLSEEEESEIAASFATNINIDGPITLSPK